MESFGVYVHVPYCRTICPYCDFNVYASKSPPWEALADAVVLELRARASLFQAGVLGSLYFGGGTPSWAPPWFLEKIARAVNSQFAIAPEMEVTLEANPGTGSLAQYEAWRALGVNRVSLGWQSTHPKLLRVLGRDHSSEEGARAFELVRQAGFENISVDLIFAAPGQTELELAQDLESLLALQPDHVSIYEMTYHERTPYKRYLDTGRIEAVDDDRVLAMTLQIEEAMVAAGFEHYEVSNFARPGKRSRHNQRYWTGGPFLGLGPGAHSFLRQGWDRGYRWESTRRPERYIRAMQRVEVGLPKSDAGVATFVDTLDRRQLLNERIMTALRLADGVTVAELFLAGAEGDFERARTEAERLGWLHEDPNYLRATPLGRRHADSLAALFF